MQQSVTPELRDTLIHAYNSVESADLNNMAGSENNKLNTAYMMSLPRRLVAGFPPSRAWFDPTSSYVGFVVDHVSLGRVCPKYSYYLAI
jgi:hypothetical protein